MIERLGSLWIATSLVQSQYSGHSFARLDPGEVGSVYRPGHIGTLSEPRHTRRAAAVYRPNTTSDQSLVPRAAPAAFWRLGLRWPVERYASVSERHEAISGHDEMVQE